MLRRELSSRFFFFQGKVLKEIQAILIETLREHAPSYATIKNWVAWFKLGDFSTCDAPHPGRPKTVTTPEIIDQIHEVILEDHRISSKSIAEQLGDLTWVGWVHHSWRFGHAEVIREVGPEIPERGSETSMVPVVWANFGIFSARSTWFSVVIGDHRRNLVISLWPGDKATISGVAA